MNVDQIISAKRDGNELTEEPVSPKLGENNTWSRTISGQPCR